MSGPLKILSRDQARAKYYVQTGSMWDNPYGVPAAEVRAMEETLPPETVAQVVYGKYVEDSGLVFNAHLLGNMFWGDQFQAEWWETADMEERIHPLTDKYGSDGRRKFIVAADLARRNDFTVVMAFDVTHVPYGPADLVFYRRLNRVSWESIYSVIAAACVRFRAEALLDSTGMGGDVVEDELSNRFFCPKCMVTVPYTLSGGTLICPSCRVEGRRFSVDGFAFSGKRKEQLITRLQNAMSYGDGWRTEIGLLKVPRIEQVVRECTFYRLDDAKLETDCVMALALSAWQLEFEEAGCVVGSIHGGVR